MSIHEALVKELKELQSLFLALKGSIASKLLSVWIREVIKFFSLSCSARLKRNEKVCKK